MSAEELTARLGAISGQNPDATVLVNGDRETSYQNIMAGIDLLNDAGVTRVSLLSRPQEARN